MASQPSSFHVTPTPATPVSSIPTVALSQTQPAKVVFDINNNNNMEHLPKHKFQRSLNPPFLVSKKFITKYIYQKYLKNTFVDKLRGKQTMERGNTKYCVLAFPIQLLKYE